MGNKWFKLSSFGLKWVHLGSSGLKVGSFGLKLPGPRLVFFSVPLQKNIDVFFARWVLGQFWGQLDSFCVYLGSNGLKMLLLSFGLKNTLVGSFWLLWAQVDLMWAQVHFSEFFLALLNSSGAHLGSGGIIWAQLGPSGLMLGLFGLIWVHVCSFGLKKGSFGLKWAHVGLVWAQAGSFGLM